MTTSRHSAMIALVAALTVAGCASLPAPSSITDTATKNPQLSTLSRLMAQSGLDDTLRAAGPYTVFAPTDEAFKSVPAKTLADLGNDKALLKAVLSYHVVPGKLLAIDIKNASAKTVNGANVALAKAGSMVTIEDAVVVQADVGATNGVVHVIDRVLLPPKQ